MTSHRFGRGTFSLLLTLTALALLAPDRTASGQAARPISPLSIEVMRQRSYPGSAVTIEQTLAPGANYRRYLASYRSDGLKIYGLLTVPGGTRPRAGWPAIVFNHGYIPPEVYRTTERYVAYVDGFARAGYVVFKPDLRGHGSSQGVAPGPYWSPDYTVDTLNAFSSLRGYKEVDPARMGMWGHSMGGHATLRAMVIDRRIRAGVIWAGVVAPYADLLESWGRPGPIPLEWRRRRESFVARNGTPASNPGFYRTASANSYLSGGLGPIQLHHGLADAEVPPAFSRTLAGQLKAAGQTGELYSYPGDDHNLSRNLGLALRRSVAFFDRYVKN